VRHGGKDNDDEATQGGAMTTRAAAGGGGGLRATTRAVVAARALRLIAISPGESETHGTHGLVSHAARACGWPVTLAFESAPLRRRRGDGERPELEADGDL
jgi:hypothetical protein